MATTVNNAFNEFLNNCVNLDSEKTKKARASRDWLIQNFKSLDFDINNHIHFGSFARRTKIRPLDDIDLMVALSNSGISYEKQWGEEVFTIKAGSYSSLAPYCDNGVLNSRKVVNALVSWLKKIPSYQHAEIKRNQEAATLKLKSYEWNFDIVPCFLVRDQFYPFGDFYLIPDGTGKWKKTDPRIDRDKLIALNRKYNGKVLNLIRIVKYWNRRKTMPTISSYLIENIVANYCSSKAALSDWIDIEFPYFLDYLSSAIYQPVYDPKNIQGDINNTIHEDRRKISYKALLDKNLAVIARNHENNDDHKSSINQWKEIFDYEFPTYG